MCELRTIGAELAATPLVPTPPLSAVQARAHGYVAARRRRSALVASVLVGLTMTGVLKLGMGPGTDAVRMVGTPPSEELPESTTSTGDEPGSWEELTGVDAGSPFLPSSGQSFDADWDSLPRRTNPCPVKVNKKLPPIKVLAHQPATSASPSPYAAIGTVIDEFNATSSICGRAVRLVDRGFDAIPADTVAVLGVPLDEDLDAHVAAGRFDGQDIAVVGGDGLSEAHHRSPAVYPVGTSAAALARTAAQHAWERGARTFAVAHDPSLPFAVEAATALTDFVARRGGELRINVAVDPAAPADAGKSEAFYRTCSNGGCDALFLAMLPDTAGTWLTTTPDIPELEVTALPTLLANSFADACFTTSNRWCDGLSAWSGFVPPFGSQSKNREAAYAWNPAPFKGLSLIEARPGSAMVEAAVVSTRVLLDALRLAGPDVTRASLRGVLERMAFESELTATLRWPAFDRVRVGNPVAQAWRLTVNTTVDAQREQDRANAARGEAEREAEATAENRLAAEPPRDRSGDVIAESERQLPGQEWHEAGTGWRSDPG